MDFKRHEMTEERFFPENQVVRSEQMFNEISKGSDLDSPGVFPESNRICPGKVRPWPDTVENENMTFEKQDRTVNYEIGKLTSHTTEPVGGIERISVAVLVDGTYRVNLQ